MSDPGLWCACARVAAASARGLQSVSLGGDRDVGGRDCAVDRRAVEGGDGTYLAHPHRRRSSRSNRLRQTASASGGSYEVNFGTCFGFTLPFECANMVILRTPGADMSAWLGLFSVTSI